MPINPLTPEQIEPIINLTNQLTIRCSQNQPLAMHCIYIKSLLTQSIQQDGVIDLSKIYETLHYIETIPIKKIFSFLGVETLAEVLVTQNNAVLPEYSRQQAPRSVVGHPRAALESHDIHCLISLHQDIFKMAKAHLQYVHYHEQLAHITMPDTAWHVTYTALADNQIMSDAISKWQKIQMILEKTPASAIDAHRDFSRNTSICGMTAGSAKDANNLINYLVQQSVYSSVDKELLKKWLHANGGQNNNRFVDLMLLHEELITPPQPKAEIGLMQSDVLNQDWGLENGFLVQRYDLCVYSLVINGESIQRDVHGTLCQWNPDSGTYPLLRVQSTIKLAIKDNQVVPQISFLKMSSFTAALKPIHPQENTQLLQHIMRFFEQRKSINNDNIAPDAVPSASSVPNNF